MSQATTTKAEASDEERSDATAAQARDKERADAERLGKKISHEATVYATIFEEVRRRMEHYAQWGERPRQGAVPGDKDLVEKVPPLLNGSDLKDVATTVYIQLSRGISWSR